MYNLLAPGDGELPVDTRQLFSQVLLIEDNRAHAQLIRRALAGLVGEIVHVATAEEAFATLSNELTELILCDLHLPDVSGAPLLQEIRKLRPGVPLIVLTSSSTLDDAVQAMREGAWDFMLKHGGQDLRAQITLVLERTAERKLRQTREAAVRAERDAFSHAAFTAQDGLAILSETGSVVFANEAFYKFAEAAGHCADEGGALNVVDLIAGQHFSVARNLSEELTGASGQASLWQSELEVAPQAGQGRKVRYHYELSLSTVGPTGLAAIGTAAGMLQYRVLWVRDISRRKEQERFQRDLLATTTHDLKGPLGSILTSAELLCDASYISNPKALELMTRVASCARSSISIIDELLSARRIQDGVLVVRPHWQCVAEVLDDTILDYHPMAKAKGIIFSARAVEEPLQVYADKIGLGRVLGNLVSNALKFTPKQGKVELSAERVPGGVQIAVSDTGPGIEASARHLLFERFGRLDRDSQTEGTGLGLFVTKNIVEAHGGSVEIKSQVGVGSTFLVTFPDLDPGSESEDAPRQGEPT